MDPTGWEDVICTLMKAVLAVGTRGACCKPARAAPGGAWALPKGKCPRAHAIGLSDGLGYLVMRLEKA